MTKLRPLGARILVKRLASEAKTAGGIIIPDDRQIKSRFGEIVAVGPGGYPKGSDKRRPLPFEVGQVVFFRGTSGQEITLDHEKGFVLLNENEVEGIQE